MVLKSILSQALPCVCFKATKALASPGVMVPQSISRPSDRDMTRLLSRSMRASTTETPCLPTSPLAPVSPLSPLSSFGPCSPLAPSLPSFPASPCGPCGPSRGTGMATKAATRSRRVLSSVAKMMALSIAHQCVEGVIILLLLIHLEHGDAFVALAIVFLNL